MSAGAPERADVGDSASALFAPPTPGAAIGALLFWYLSLWPTLLPRSAVNQGAISGICAALGWMIGVALGGIVMWSLRGWGTTAGSTLHRWFAFAAGGVAALLVVVGLGQWHGWQGAQRDVMGMGHLPRSSLLWVVALSAVVLGVLVLLGRLVAAAVRRIDRWVARRLLRPRWARLATVVLVLVLVRLVSNVLGGTFVGWADSSFGAFDEGTPPGVELPTATTVSGSPESLVAWETLGYYGREFVAQTTGLEELTMTARAGVEPLEPIRVYVGLDSADTIDERAALVVDELDRTGAFDREVLVVATTTGSGWINPVASRSIEHLHAGDTAIATLQYSFLPSWIAFLLDIEAPAESSVSLFEAVHARWSQLDPSDRPRLVVFGESLGSFGMESAFATDDASSSFTSLIERTDGALFVGPTVENLVYSQLVAERDPGSPSWQPALADVSEVQVADTVDDIAAGDSGWPEPRILYLTHPTDAIGTWRPSHIWSRPAWTQEPLGNGILGATQWFPVTTFVQESFDLMAGFSSETGFGHDYNNSFVEAWVAIAAPAGWSEADTAELAAALRRS